MLLYPSRHNQIALAKVGTDSYAFSNNHYLAHSMASPPPIDSTGLTAKCALMVDDDPYISELVAEMLRGIGMQEIYLESDVAHALASIELHQPDLLICDLALPDVDGIEFLNSLAQQKFSGAVVLFSGMGEPILRAARQLAAANGLRVLDALCKPMTKQDLQNILAQLSVADTTQEIPDEPAYEPASLD